MQTDLLNLLQQTPVDYATTAARSQLKAGQWKQALEQEQQHLLKQMRSVKAADHHSTNADHPTSAHTARTNGMESASAVTSLPKATATANNTPADSNYANAFNIQHNSTNPAGKQMPALPPISLVSNSYTDPFTNLSNATLGVYQNAEQLAHAIAFLESHYKQKWPFRNIHLQVDDNAVSMWIRDRELSSQNATGAPNEALQTLVQHLQARLQSDGRFLQRLYLNGQLVFEQA